MELAIFLAVYFIGYLISLPIAGWWFSKDETPIYDHDYASITGTMFLWPFFIFMIVMFFLVQFVGDGLLWFSKYLIDFGRRFNKK